MATFNVTASNTIDFTGTIQVVPVQLGNAVEFSQSVNAVTLQQAVAATVELTQAVALFGLVAGSNIVEFTQSAVGVVQNNAYRQAVKFTQSVSRQVIYKRSV